MRKTSYHMYTRRCMHASGKDEEYIINAIKNGYEEIGFSDHSSWNYDSDFVANMRIPLLKFDDYYVSVSSLKEEYRNRISIEVGLEYEYLPEYIDWLEQFLIDKKLDCIIFGNHYFKADEEHMYFGTACEEEAWPTAYVDEAVAGMRTNLYSCLCRPDLFVRDRRVSDEVAERESICLCQATKELHIPLEYNLAGAAYNDIVHAMQYPHIDFWKTTAEVNNTTIVGVDAHEPAALEIDSYREEGIALFSGLGMKITDTLPLEDFTGYK